MALSASHFHIELMMRRFSDTWVRAEWDSNMPEPFAVVREHGRAKRIFVLQTERDACSLAEIVGLDRGVRGVKIERCFGVECGEIAGPEGLQSLQSAPFEFDRMLMRCPSCGGPSTKRRGCRACARKAV